MSFSGVILLLITLLDTFVTAIAINTGRAYELNPFIAWIIENTSLFTFVIFKSMVSLLVIAILDRKISRGGDDEKIARCLYLIANCIYFVLCLFYMIPLLLGLYGVSLTWPLKFAAFVSFDYYPQKDIISL